MKSFVKPFAALCVVLLMSNTSTQAQNVAVNDNGAAPNAKAMLDVNYLGAAPKKGMLIPRMLRAQRVALAGPMGLTVYQTDAFSATEAQGFYFHDGTVWKRVYTGPTGWEVGGNAGTNPTTQFIGTTDNQPIVIRANAVEVARLSQTGNLGIGQNNPLEKLDVAGAIKLTGTSATNNAGTIRYNPAGYHEGNKDGTVPGWKKLQNAYVEIFGQTYTQPGAVTCGSGSSVIIANNGTSAAPNVTPFTNVYNRARHQYLFRVDELNVSLNQLFNNPLATKGICAGEPINQIGFWVVSGTMRPWFYSISIKHTTLTTLTGFDNTVDPAGRCLCYGAGPTCVSSGFLNQPQVVGGYTSFTFQDINGLTPFIWDGSRNVILEVCYLAGGSAAGQVNATVRATSGLSFNGSYSKWGQNTDATCTTVGACGNTSGCAIGSAACGVGGGVNVRPEVQWTSFAPGLGIATALPPPTGTGAYVNYNGGLLVQDQVAPDWASSTVPYSFKGPGTISAENGVWASNSRLNDHVFDRYFDGRVAPHELDEFGQVRALGVNEMVNYVETRRHLPTMKGRSEWEKNGGFSIDDLTDQLWSTTETQSLYLTELNDRMHGLEMLSTNRPLTQQEFDQLRNMVCSMDHLSEAEKNRLIEKNGSRIQNTQK